MDFVHPMESVIPGAQGRVLAVLSRSSTELNLRTISRLSGTSPAQTSRVLPRLVELGLVYRREAPPSALFRMNHDHLLAEPLNTIAEARARTLELIKFSAATIEPSPVSVVIFGSFSRGEADANSDIDVLVVRPDGVAEDDLVWVEGVAAWSDALRTLTGNRVEVLEVAREEAARRLSSSAPLWRDVIRDGLLVHGAALDVPRKVGNG